ncbi:MAG: sigma-70 family RNA polymerase sigma factor [Actinobacteria bacterium]|nr:sigma-70 family RNA polymerase sigma factor [Actinomycetota bacterium]
MTTGQLAQAIAAQLPGLLRYARTLTSDAATAEDLVQETVTRALERAESFRYESSPATWLHSILHNLAMDHIRRSHEVPVADIVDRVEAAWRDDSYTVDAEQVVIRAQDAAQLRDALVHLPVIYRSALLLHDGAGLTTAQVAQIHRIGLPAAKQRLRRGRMMLVSELGRADERAAATRGVPLRCWDARRSISDYLDGALDAATAGRVVGHLRGCPTCPPLYAALVAATGALASGGTPAPDAGARDPDSVVPPALARRLDDLPGPRS